MGSGSRTCDDPPTPRRANPPGLAERSAGLPEIEGGSADTENTAPLRRQHRLKPTGLITTPAAPAPLADIRTATQKARADSRRS